MRFLEDWWTVRFPPSSSALPNDFLVHFPSEKPQALTPTFIMALAPLFPTSTSGLFDGACVRAWMHAADGSFAMTSCCFLLLLTRHMRRRAAAPRAMAPLVRFAAALRAA